MAFSLGALIVDLEARTGKFETDMGRAAGIMKRRTAELDRDINRYTTKISKYIGAAVLGLGALIVKNTKDAQASLAQLDAAVKSTGGAAGFTTPQLVEMSKALQKTTIFADDAIQAMQSVLLTFTRISGPEFEAAQQAIVDISSRLGKDLQASAILVGKALNDPIKGMLQMSKAGIQFSESQTKAIKNMVALNDFAGAQGIILGELQKKFGGAATAARETFGGALAGLKNAFGDLFEVSTEGTNEATESILGLTKALQDQAIIQGVHTLTASIVTLIGKIGEAIAGLTILFTGKGGNASVNLDIQIDKTKSKLDTLTQSLGVFNKSRSEQDKILAEQFGSGVDTNPLVKQIRELRVEYDKLIAKQKEVMGNVTLINTGSHGGQRGGAAETQRLLLAKKFEELVPTEAFEKQSKTLEKQIALFGKTGEAAKVAYDIASGALEDMHPAEQQHLLALAQQYDAIVSNAVAEKEALELVATGYDQVANAAIRALDYSEKVMRTFSSTRVSDALAAIEASRLQAPLVQGDVGGAELPGLGNLNQAIEDVGDRAIPEMGEAFKLTVTEMSVFADQAARNIQGALADFLFDPFDKGLKGMLKGFIDIIRRMIAEAAAAQILKSLFGGTDGLSGFLGGLFGGMGGAASGGGGFGGGMASGGPVAPGRHYLVGERGPELFSPSTAGNITARGGLGNTIAPTYNTYIDSRTDQNAIRQYVAAANQENNRQLMKLIPDMRSRGANI